MNRRDDPAERIILKAYNIVTDMEDDLGAARTLARGVNYVAADSIEDVELGGFLMRLASLIESHCRAVEERRGELFRLLHPNRDHFEKEGWPGDAVRSEAPGSR